MTEFKTNKVQALLKVCAGDHWNDRSLQAEKRGLSTLRATMRDRAMQALVKLAFEPEW